MRYRDSFVQRIVLNLFSIGFCIPAMLSANEVISLIGVVLGAISVGLLIYQIATRKNASFKIQAIIEKASTLALKKIGIYVMNDGGTPFHVNNIEMIKGTGIFEFPGGRNVNIGDTQYFVASLKNSTSQKIKIAVIYNSGKGKKTAWISLNET